MLEAPNSMGPVTRAIRAMRNDEPEPQRRGFLRGLVSLPFIGGGLTLIGAPTAVAAPCTDDTLLRYCAFLAHEHRAAIVERTRRQAEASIARAVSEGERARPEYLDEIVERTRKSPHMFWFPAAPAVERVVGRAEPSTRAALVLSAVGCEWRS